MPATNDEIAARFMEMVLRYGYRRTSLDDVARTLRISKATIYDGFGSKEGLLAYGMQMLAVAQRDRVRSALAADSALDRIDEVIAIALAETRRYYESNPPEEEPEQAELSARINDEVFRPLVRDLIGEGIESGEIAVPDPDLAAVFCMAVGMSAVEVLRHDPSARPEAAVAKAVRRMLEART